MATHADTVAQQGSAGYRARRVNRHNRNSHISAAKFTDQAVYQGRFTGAGRTGNSHYKCPSGMRIKMFQYPDPGDIIFFQQPNQPGSGQLIAVDYLLD
jgi:hypothetical protein